jgi:hypothetical protein
MLSFLLATPSVPTDGGQQGAITPTVAGDHLSMLPKRLSDAEQAAYTYWEERAAANELGPFKPIIPSKSMDTKEQKQSYDQKLWPGSECKDWCSLDIKINRTDAELRGRQIFPPNDIADWSEKCSWDALCAGCPQCDNPVLAPMAATCASFCGILNDDTLWPPWKKTTRPCSETCGFGPCHSCEKCGWALCGEGLPCGMTAAATCTDNGSETCINDERCADTKSDPFGGLGCNAGGVAQSCRFCDFTDAAGTVYPPCSSAPTGQTISGGVTRCPYGREPAPEEPSACLTHEYIAHSHSRVVGDSAAMHLYVSGFGDKKQIKLSDLRNYGNMPNATVHDLKYFGAEFCYQISSCAGFNFYDTDVGTTTDPFIIFKGWRNSTSVGAPCFFYEKRMYHTPPPSAPSSATSFRLFAK